MVSLVGMTPDEVLMVALRREPAVVLSLPRTAAWGLAQALVNGMRARAEEALNHKLHQNAERVMDLQITRLLDVVKEHQAAAVKGDVVFHWTAAQVWVAVLLVETAREDRPNTPAARVMEAMTCYLVSCLPRWARLQLVESCNLTARMLRVVRMTDPVARF